MIYLYLFVYLYTNLTRPNFAEAWLLWLPSTSFFIISSFSRSNEENSKTLSPKRDFAYWLFWGREWGKLGKIVANCTVGMFGDEICPSFLYNLVMAKREEMIASQNSPIVQLGPITTQSKPSTQNDQAREQQESGCSNTFVEELQWR